MIYPDPLWADLLSAVNIFFAGLLAIYSFRRARRETDFARWMMVLLGLIGAYWCGLYLMIFIMPSGTFDPVWFGRIAVRPAFTFTLAVMASMAFYRWKRP